MSRDVRVKDHLDGTWKMLEKCTSSSWVGRVFLEFLARHLLGHRMEWKVVELVACLRWCLTLLWRLFQVRDCIALSREILFPLSAAVRALPASSFPVRMNDRSLEAEALVIERDHRSSGDLPTFMLSVPSFSIRGGECVTLLGENGTGKSSFSRVLSGLLKERSGRVLFDGKEVSWRERRHI